MTREEAIWWVNHLFEIRKEEYFNKSMMEDAKEVEQAQHMAIEALSADKPKVSIDYAPSPYTIKTTSTDLISRADAIEAMCDDCEGAKYPKCGQIEWCSEVNALLTLPSAELTRANLKQEFASADAVQRWIPCSERLPSESGDYLCTIPLDVDETYTEVLTFHKGRFYEDDDEWGATYHDDVLAWMPLPTPYTNGGYE